MAEHFNFWQKYVFFGNKWQAKKKGIMVEHFHASTLILHHLAYRLLPVREGELQEVETGGPGGHVQSEVRPAVQVGVGIDGLSQTVVRHNALHGSVASDGDAVVRGIGPCKHFRLTRLLAHTGRETAYGTIQFSSNFTLQNIKKGISNPVHIDKRVVESLVGTAYPHCAI